MMTRRPLLALPLFALALLLAGCASLTGGEKIRSSPVLRLTDARVTDTQAALQIEIENPGDYGLTLTGIDYELIYGPLPVADVPDPECPRDGAVVAVRACGVCRSDHHAWKGAGPLPMAEGLWSGRRPVAPGETINLNLPVGFDQEPSDTSAAEVEFRGSMMFGDRPGAESLNEAPFSVSAPARR